MPLRGPRFAGDKVLEKCLLGEHRMFAPEQGLAVMRVQAALIELGHSVGPAGADGIFGSATGNAVSAYKVEKNLSPSDPVVGKGTIKALDDDLFFEPPSLDPLFAEFSPAVASRHVDPLIGVVLAGLLGAPLGSWRQMLARFALSSLTSGRIFAIFPDGRRDELRERYLLAAAPVQQGGVSAANWFDTSFDAGAIGQVVPFIRTNGSTTSFVKVRDNVILGREAHELTATGEKAPVTLAGVLGHELTHVRNIANEDKLEQTPDTDSTTYVDTALAAARTATGIRTGSVVEAYVGEMCARHVHWLVIQETAGTPAALAAPAPDAFASGLNLYFERVAPNIDRNGYIAGINAQGAATRFRQLDLWLRLCQGFSFSDDAAENTRTQALYRDAAAVCANRATQPTVPLPAEDGLFPLPKDFH